MKWTREHLRAELVALFRRRAQGDVEVTESSHIVADLSIDSLGIMEIIADIEDKFQLQIPDEILREVNTIADVAQQIEGKLQAEGRLAE